jgi:hypothetical protein
MLRRVMTADKLPSGSCHVVSPVTPNFRDRWLLANTYITSRSFPSTLLQLDLRTFPSGSQPTDTDGNSDDGPYGIMLPGIDLLNHKRAEPVSWTSRPGRDGKGEVGFSSRKGYKAGEQIWNNYGPKGE